MNFSTFVMFLLVVSGIFFMFASMTAETNSQYSDANINTSQWEGRYDYVAGINSTIAPLKQKFDVITDEKQGFFTKLASGIAAIPYAIIIFPQVVFGGLSLGSNVSVGLLAALAIPSYIILLVTVMILVWALFKLVEFFQRVRV